MTNTLESMYKNYLLLFEFKMIYEKRKVSMPDSSIYQFNRNLICFIVVFFLLGDIFLSLITIRRIVNNERTR